MATSSKKSNFLVIVADDLGFTDTAPFGGEIDTPNLTRLANSGLRFTDFHTASACSPTRSMLLSGTDNHIAGLGQMAEFAREFPEQLEGKDGYEGYLNFRVAALSEILHDNGYWTCQSGKWHLGLFKQYWPSSRGFDRSYGLLSGAGNHFKYFPKAANGEYLGFLPPIYQEDGKKLDPDTELADDFHSTIIYTDKIIDQISDPERGDKPFLALLTHTAPHWPYQAPRDVIAKYKGVYDNGPARLREQRLNSALKAGVIPEGVEAHEVESFRDKPWDDLTDDEKKFESRIMEVYAAMVDVLDQQIGRVLDHLESTGELENTMIFFMSDNGAEGMIMEAMAVKNEKTGNMIKQYYDNSYDNIGNANSFVWYSDQWAQAATAPHYMYKMWASEGGIRCPLIVSAPHLIKKEEEGSVKRAFVTVMDILPTILDVAGITHPYPDFQGRKVVKPRGDTWLPYISGQSEQVHDDEKVTGWELFAQQAIRKGGYKALFIPAPIGPDKWQLFDLKKDPGEIYDLAEKEPEVLKELLTHWTTYVAETGLVDLRDVFYSDAFRIEHGPRPLLYESK